MVVWSTALWSDVYHRSPVWIIIYHLYLLYASLHRTTLQTTIFHFWHFILVTFLPFNRNFNKNIWILTVEWSLHTVSMFVFVHLTTLKITTWVAQTWQLSPCNKITFLKPKCIFWSL